MSEPGVPTAEAAGTSDAWRQQALGPELAEAPIDHLVEGMEELVPEGERHLLVVLPHPDDETFVAAGTMARCADAGVPVTFLCGTYGDMGRRMGSPLFATRESLRDIRQQELADACAILGATPRWLGLRDRTVEFERPESVAERVRAVMREQTPSTVITFFPDYSVHPDHDAFGAAALLAVQGLDAPRPRLLAMAVGEPGHLRAELGPPHVYCDIRSVRQRKLDALRAHRSQTEMMFQRRERGEPDDAESNAFFEELLLVERFYVLPLD